MLGSRHRQHFDLHVTPAGVVGRWRGWMDCSICTFQRGRPTSLQERHMWRVTPRQPPTSWQVSFPSSTSPFADSAHFCCPSQHI